MEGMALLRDESIDIIPADPPFGIDYQSNRATEKLPKIANDKEPFVDWLPLAFQKMKQGGRLFIFYRWDVGEAFRQAAKDAGFKLVWELVWDKVAYGVGDLKGCPSPGHELILYCTKGRFEFKGKRPRSVYRIARPTTGARRGKHHPNEKPVNLYKALYRDFRGHEDGGTDIVCDPFAGSANSLMAAQAMGLQSIGWEITDHYYQQASKRLNLSVQADLF